jgi:hypothetical protein
MGDAVKKNVVLAPAVLAAGWLLRTMDSITGIHPSRWMLGDLIWWASFSFAAVLAAATAARVGDAQRKAVLQSTAASSLTGAALLAVALWLLSTGARPVLVAAWAPAAQKIVAIGTIVIVG